MGTAGIGLVHGIEPADLAHELDRLYCYEQVAIHWARAVDNRLTGPATFMIDEHLLEQVTIADRHAGRLAARIAQLGSAITPDPTQFVERPRIGSVEMPDDTSDPVSVIGYALGREQQAIRRYGQLIDRVRGADAVTERLLTSILSDKVAQEDQLESALTGHHPANATHEGRPRR